MSEKKFESRYLTAIMAYKYLGISKSTFYKVLKEDSSFPKGLLLTGSKKVYDKLDLDNWLKSRNSLHGEIA